MSAGHPKHPSISSGVHELELKWANPTDFTCETSSLSLEIEDGIWKTKRPISHQLFLLMRILLDHTSSPHAANQLSITLPASEPAFYSEKVPLVESMKRASPVDHPLPCGHAYCDVCAAWYGSPVEGAEYEYSVRHCALCHKATDILIRVLPPTASVRAITIDGGGVRAIMPLRFLGYMQKILGPGCLVQDMVDVAFGTSGGGIAVLKAFRQRRPISECQQTLADLIVRFFQGHPPLRTTWNKLIRTILCWWKDGWYDAGLWDGLLQKEFGVDQGMFDVQPVSGTKVAVTAVADQPVLLINYRRVVDPPGQRCVDHEMQTTGVASLAHSGGYYRVYTAPDPEHEPQLWKCCADGGLKHNNPALICRAETPFMWESNPVPGTLISLGTGKAGRPRRQRWRRGFAFRLYDSFLASMDAEQAWEDLLGQVDPANRRNYHRLNVTFPDQEPLLNAAAQVEWMTELADKTAERQVPGALTSLLLASFFFELSSPPCYNDGIYQCCGAIRGRLRGKYLVQALRRLHPQASTFVLGTSRLGVSPFEDVVCCDCARYCVPVKFEVDGLDSNIMLALELHPHQLQPLGGFPLSLRHLVDRLRINMIGCPGLPKLPARTECKSCELRIRRKARPDFENSSYRKRVRFI
ncbi:hypothetical protein AtubIFM54640_010321 [Aspergillus tubingensis]|nr:hypothetical protein AtubIFM54640_010321 [Aspergillus tubingensis]